MSHNRNTPATAAALPLRPPQHSPAAPPIHGDRPPKRDGSSSRKAVMCLICNTSGKGVRSTLCGHIAVSCCEHSPDGSPSNENKISYGRAVPVSPPRPNKKSCGLALRLSAALASRPFEMIEMMPNGEAPVYLRVSKSPPAHPARWLPSRGREMRAHRSAFPSSDFRTSGQCQNRPNLC